MKLCPKCGTQYPDDANFCHLDAARLVEDRRVSAPAAVAETRSATGGRVLGGRFELGERIGGGLTGKVYRGTDQKTGRPCAVKLVDTSVFPSSLLMQRTERELSKLARIDAEGITKIIAHGREGDTMWIASELVAGARSLHDIVFDEGPMKVERASSVVVSVGKALAEAARLGVIHRDLAPKNVLVGTSGAIKVINFGVAAPTTDKVQGVAEYVAPEIIEGKPVDQRSSIYSLGAMYYYLLTGRPPYMGEPEEVHEQHLRGIPEPPSTHAEGISESLDMLILRALERSSSKRFMTLRQLLTDVEQIAAGNEPASSASSLARMGRGKDKKDRKLSSTMLGGFRVVEGKAGADAVKSPAAAPVGDGSSGSGSMPAMAAQDAAQQVSGAAEEPVAPLPEIQQPRAPEAVAVSGSMSGAALEPVAVRASTQAGAGERNIEVAAEAPAGSSEPGHAPMGELRPEHEAAAASAAAMASVAPAAQAPAAQAPANQAEGADSGAEPVSPAGIAQEAGKLKARARSGQKAQFRETMWFKKGALESAAEAAADSKSNLAKADHLPIEDRYQDDGSLSTGDRDQFSLKTGATEVMRAVRPQGRKAGESVTDGELIKEMKGGRGKIILAIVVCILIIAGIIAFAIVSNGGGPAAQGGSTQPPASSTQPPATPAAQ